MDQKQSWRRRLLQARDQLEGRQAKSAAIQGHLAGLPAYREAGSVISYVGVKSEVPTLDILAERLNAGLSTGVVAVSGSELLAIRIDDTAELGPAPFGLLEPVEPVRSDPARRMLPGEADALLIPGVGFDHDGWRLGYGKGFYDRLLRRAGSGPSRIALAFEVQVVDHLPHGPGDEPVHWLVTESGALRLADG